MGMLRIYYRLFEFEIKVRKYLKQNKKLKNHNPNLDNL